MSLLPRNDYDDFDFLRDQMTHAELTTINDIIETEFEDLREEIEEVYHNQDITIDFSRDAEPIYTQFLDHFNEFYIKVLELIDLEEEYITRRLNNED